MNFVTKCFTVQSHVCLGVNGVKVTQADGERIKQVCWFKSQFQSLFFLLGAEFTPLISYDYICIHHNVPGKLYHIKQN